MAPRSEVEQLLLHRQVFVRSAEALQSLLVDVNQPLADLILPVGLARRLVDVKAEVLDALDERGGMPQWDPGECVVACRRCASTWPEKLRARLPR